MKPKLLVALALRYFLMSPAMLLADAPAVLPAFPGAEGFGAQASGGRGGEVYHVTNLDDSGPGSLRDGVSKGKRIVVFDVGGVIEIKTPLVVASNITVAGQSAPVPGITVYGDAVSLSNRTNIIVRHVRLRQGIQSARGSKVINISKGSNMIFDHVSASWGRWDTIGVTQQSSRITFQNCLFAEAIDPQRFGGLIDSSTEITICRTLWMNNQSRNPKLKANAQYVNNLVYNWGASGVPGGHSAAVWNQDIVNNLFIKGPSSTDKFFDLFAATDHVYQSGNIADLDKDGVLNGREVVEADYRGETPPTFSAKPFNTPAIAVTVLSVPQAYQAVLAGAGACLMRDAVDLRLIEQLQSLGTKGAIIHNEAEIGGQPVATAATRPPNFDTDRDGMADDWERAHGLSPADATDGNSDIDNDGYTNIEEYLENPTVG
jgi:pectate lyase